MKMSMKKITTVICLVIGVTACTSSEIGESKDVNPETVSIQYTIAYDEGNEKVDCEAKFRFGGDKGTTLVLSKPSKIELDDIAIMVDSNKVDGAFYKTYKAVSNFAGKHTWKFTDINKKTYTETFDFTPFSLAKPIPASIDSKELELFFTGLKNGDMVNVAIKDTSATTTNIDGAFTVSGGKVVIPSADIRNLKKGPLKIDIETKTSQNLKNSTREGGTIAQRFSLKQRETILSQ